MSRCEWVNHHFNERVCVRVCVPIISVSANLSLPCMGGNGSHCFHTLQKNQLSHLGVMGKNESTRAEDLHLEKTWQRNSLHELKLGTESISNVSTTFFGHKKRVLWDNMELSHGDILIGL